MIFFNKQTNEQTLQKPYIPTQKEIQSQLQIKHFPSAQSNTIETESPTPKLFFRKAE